MRKSRFVFAIVCMVLLLIAPLNSMTALATDGGYEAIVFKGTPTVDGDLSEWKNVNEYSMSQRVVDGTAETTGSFKAMYDGTALYFAGEFVDATNSKGNDQVKFLFDFDGVPVGESEVTFANRANAGVHTWNGEGINGAGGNSLDPKVWNPVNAYCQLQSAGTQVMGDGKSYSLYFSNYANGVYTFEASWYPTDALKNKLKEGTVIGFDIRYNDFNDAASQTDTRHTTLGWASDKFDWNTDLRAIGGLKLAGYQDVSDNMQYISCNDERLNYLGRWKAEGEGMKVSYWTTPSVSFAFTGTTLYLDLAEKSSIGVELDGVVTDYTIANGKMEIPVAEDGTHTVKIYGPNMHLKGFYVAADSTVTAVEDKKYYAMFIGDSITADHRSFSFNSAREAGWDWSVLCLDGIALSTENIGYYHDQVSGWGYYTNGYYNPNPLAGWNASMRIGMETAFFNYERPLDKLDNFTPYNDFENERKPNAIFIALGVNDHLSSTTLCQTFVDDYVSFVKKLRDNYPNATIYIMQALVDNGYGTRYSSIRQAANTICETDKNVVFVADTSTWGVKLSKDGVHPSTEGYATLTTKVKKILEEYVPYNAAQGEDSSSSKPSGGTDKIPNTDESDSDKNASGADSPVTGQFNNLLGIIGALCISSGSLWLLCRKKQK